MGWFKISSPRILLGQNILGRIHSDYANIISGNYNNEEIKGAALLCDDENLTFGDVYISPKAMKLPLISKYFDGLDPYECDIKEAKQLFFLAGDKRYGARIIKKNLTIKRAGIIQ